MSYGLSYRNDLVYSAVIATRKRGIVTRVTVYSTGTCPICVKAKALLDKWGIGYQEVRIDTAQEALREFSRVTQGARTVPQIVIDGKCIGGFSELTELHMEGELDDLMQPSA